MGLLIVLYWHRLCVMGEGDGGTGGTGMYPLKFGETIFSDNYYEKVGHFSGKNRVKFWNFVNFLEKYYKNSGIMLIFRARIM